ncbi:hypothetical protein MNBD_NITROSPINAE04-1591 [hydrothermal vent metagenome]|uniref:BFD-like [2Fe-2S]-binding domain-containing protein n=1 Tax=hydrothermal vent metagenome TaxID=652676 RepID=A0A3B1C437_9ZZZZ
MSQTNSIIDDLKVVCQCKNIKKGLFRKLIDNGERSIDCLRRETGAGSGDCGGKRCSDRIKAMLKVAS